MLPIKLPSLRRLVCRYYNIVVLFAPEAHMLSTFYNPGCSNILMNVYKILQEADPLHEQL